MMKKNIIALILLALTINVSFTSCEDMLTGDMDRNVGIEEIAADTLYSYWGILKSLQSVAERYVILGECRGDLVDGSDMYVSDSISAILSFGMKGSVTDGSNRFLRISDFYHVINSCNAYIQQCDTAALTGLNRSVMKSEYAQVVTIRAWMYLQLVLTYGRVPYFEKPMLTTDEMKEFRNAPQYIDANTLAQSGVVQKVEEVLYVPYLYANDPSDVIPYPNYYMYGGASGKNADANTIANATQCIFPQDVVLGDIYLLSAQGSGSEADYRRAAQHYYNFFNSDKGGTLRQSYYGMLRMRDADTKQYYLSTNAWVTMFYNNLSSTSQTQELVTIIPSSKSKLDGTVFRALNELFGFDQTLAVSGDSTGTGSVRLEPNFQHQLDASKAYLALNKAQNFEVYVGTDKRCYTFPGAGDARYRMATDNYTDYETGSADEVPFVVKQNPLGAFTTTYPVIYRKASIWLHYAEALNGAGFPGYAFAILRHGLVGSNGWLPVNEESYDYITFKYYDPTNAEEANPNPSYASYVFFDPTTETEEVKPVQYTDYMAFFNDMLHPGLELCTTKKDTTDFVAAHMSYESKTREFQAKNGVICKYISQRETEAAKSAPFLNFDTNYLKGEMSSYYYYYGTTEDHITSVENDPHNLDAFAMGIHARGCGFLKLEDEETSYNFVDQINKMRHVYDGITTPMTEEEIYDPANLRKVQEAMANLILDELGLETAFEGNRFYDLLCYSRFMGANGVEKVAKRIALRNGLLNNPLYNHLCNQQNWFFPLEK